MSTPAHRVIVSSALERSSLQVLSLICADLHCCSLFQTIRPSGPLVLSDHTRCLALVKFTSAVRHTCFNRSGTKGAGARTSRCVVCRDTKLRCSRAVSTGEYVATSTREVRSVTEATEVNPVAERCMLNIMHISYSAGSIPSVNSLTNFAAIANGMWTVLAMHQSLSCTPADVALVKDMMTKASWHLLQVMHVKAANSQVTRLWRWHCLFCLSRLLVVLMFEAACHIDHMEVLTFVFHCML